MPRSSADGSGTAARILDAAELLVQSRGFNGFSYADVAAEVGVTKASLHYHFPSKAILGRTLIARYSSRFAQALEEIRQERSAPVEKLNRYIGLYRDVLCKDRLCLCGVLAAEYATLPVPMQSEVRQFFAISHEWLDDLLDIGRSDGSFHFVDRPQAVAMTITAALEGAMLVAHSFEDPAHFDGIASQLVAHIVHDH